MAVKNKRREAFEAKDQVVKDLEDQGTAIETPDVQEAVATIPADQSKLSPIQQEISGYVTTAKKEPPKITDVRELFNKVEMAVPKGVSRGPEYSYCWLGIGDLSSISGTKWEIVNRSNHSHAPQRMFDRAGAILYKGQNILAFCYTEARELEQAAIVADFNSKTDVITKPQENASDREVRNIPIANAGNIVSGGLVDAYVDQEIHPPEKDDF